MWEVRDPAFGAATVITPACCCLGTWALNMSPLKSLTPLIFRYVVVTKWYPILCLMKDLNERMRANCLVIGSHYCCCYYYHCFPTFATYYMILVKSLIPSVAQFPHS